jgi:drug/metabolite transporter (DMT)-like permease
MGSTGRLCRLRSPRDRERASGGTGPVDSGRQALSGVALALAAVIGLVLGAVLSRALRKVRVASEEKLTFGRGVGVLVFVLGILTGGFAGEAAHSMILDREPARRVSGFVTCGLIVAAPDGLRVRTTTGRHRRAAPS